MRWGKIVLLFQAMATLIIGIIFLTQLMTIGNSGVKDLNINTKDLAPSTQNAISKITDMQSRFAIASYALFVISLAELIIISRHLR